MEADLQPVDTEPRQTSARIWLVVAYAFFAIYATGLMVMTAFEKDSGWVPVEALFILIGFITLYGILTTLPMLLVIGYQRNQLATLKSKVREDLWLCGLDGKQLSSKMQAFGDRNSWGAFILPAVLTMIFLGVMWSFFLLPEGPSGLKASLYAKGAGSIDVSRMLKSVVDSPSVILITFLGAYFYIISVLIRRWLRADLTTGVLWKINVRLAMALLVGFLLELPANVESIMAISQTNGILLMIGFLAGIVPDTVLRWLTQQARKIVSPKGENKGGLFKPSDLQENINGLNFWQVDRLFEEGIESVQDLAMKEIPDLLINTRFDTPQVLYWVDQALLSNQVSDQAGLFWGAFIKTASDLVDLAGGNQHGLEQVLNAIQDGQRNRSNGQSPDGSENGAYAMTQALLENILEGLRNGPNLPYVQAYWANTSSPERRAEKLAELEQLSSIKAIDRFN